jgi:hypothetical protein
LDTVQKRLLFVQLLLAGFDGGQAFVFALLVNLRIQLADLVAQLEFRGLRLYARDLVAQFARSPHSLPPLTSQATQRHAELEPQLGGAILVLGRQALHQL